MATPWFAIHYSYGSTKEAVKFQVKQPPTLQKNDVLKAINFDESWITILKD